MYDRIKLLCKKHRIYVKDLEAVLGFGVNTMNKWDSISPSIDKVIKVADYFGVSLDEICGRSCSEIPNSSESGDKTTFADFGSMTAEENRILELFRSLNEEGQEHALAVLEGLAASGIYKKRDIAQMVEA